MAEEITPNVPAIPPDEWPPASEHMAEALLDIFSQHLMGQRDRVVRHAYETLVQRQPYAHGRVHQRPFAALDELNLDEAARDKIVNVVAVFVDEAIEHVLSLLGSQMNTVGEHDTVEYGLSAQIHHHQLPAQTRYSLESLSAAVHQDLERLLSNPEDVVPGKLLAQERAEEEKALAFPKVTIGQGQPLWFNYRKWLARYCTFRRSARP